MSILIAYASKHGCTKKCAEMLAQKLNGSVELHDIKSGKAVDLSQYDSVIVGSSVYVGNVHKEVKDFCASNMDVLKNKKLGFFICGMQPEEGAQTELKMAYPGELTEKAAAVDCFGGEFIFKNMSFMEKTIVKMIAKTSKDVSDIKLDKIESFAQAISNT